MNFIKRFSLLLLEPGEIYFCDNAASYRFPEKERNEKEGWETAWFQEEIQGRLMICSKSLVFDPKIKPIPLLKLPLKYCSSIKVVNASTADEANMNGSHEDRTLEIMSSVVVEMLENNVIKPYKFRKTNCSKHSFELNFSKASEVLPLILQLQRASTLPPNDHNFMIEAIVRSLQNRIVFNYTHVRDSRETKVLEVKTSKVTPLVKNPGRILITSCALYYQPFNNIEKDPVLRIPFNAFKRVIKRRYLLRQVGLEIFYKERSLSKYLYLIFKETEERDEAYKCLMQQENLEMEDLKLETMAFKWQVGKISNYEYLMFLNSQADRSVNDLTQYPVFPWVIADYVSEELDLSNPDVYRDLTKPVGALNKERLLRLKERCKDMGEPKFLFGSHYSTPGFVLYYLVRQYPLYMLCLQNGKFDHPDRMFNSISATWDNVTTNSSDFKELIPEFFDTESSGSFLKNEKAISFGTRQCGDPVWDVILPPWAKDASQLIRTMRRALESDYVSYNLHHWIDLIFGFKQKGEEAVKADNVFYHLCYEGAVDLSKITDLQEKISMEVQIMEFGQIPKQLFTRPHLQKSCHLCLYNDLRLIGSLQDSFDRLLNENGTIAEVPCLLPLYSSINSVTKLEESKLHRSAITYTMFVPNGQVVMSLGKDGFLKAYSFPSLAKVGHLDSGSLAFSCCVHLPGTTEVLIGCWDNYLYRFNYKLCQKKDGLQAHSDAISCLDINSEVLVTGSWDCLVRIWDMTKVPTGQVGSCWSAWRLHLDYLICQIDHDAPVNCVVINPQKQLFASATTDGFVNIYHLRKDFRILNFQSHIGPVNGLVWSPDGENVASCGDDGKFVLLETINGNKIADIDFGEALKCMLFDGRMAVLGGASGCVIFYDVPKAEIIKKMEAHEGAVTAITLSPNRMHFVTGGEDKKIILWGKSKEIQ